jgi:hypothetical protein
MCIRALPCRSPDERQRNPGPPFTFQKSFPDFTEPVIGPARGPHRARAMGVPRLRAGPVGSSGLLTTKKGRRNAGRRNPTIGRIFGCGARPTGRARLSAFHRGACGSEPTPPLSSSTRFLGRGRGAQSRWFERPCAAQRALPAPSCPSPASSSQTGHSAGRAYSQSRPRTRLQAPSAGTALAPSFGCRRRRPFDERDSLHHVT